MFVNLTKTAYFEDKKPFRGCPVTLSRVSTYPYLYILYEQWKCGSSAPTELGSYVLQWRWDNEQTPQVWTTCADINVVARKSGAVARHHDGLLSCVAAALATVAVFLVM